MENYHPLIIGGGPAGITTADALVQHKISSTTIEQDKQVGGLCKTVEYRGFRCDIGGHRFFTKNQEIQKIWEGVLGQELLVRPRLSRIYYRGRFFHYPLKIGNALMGLGPVNSTRIVSSYCKSRLFPTRNEVSFEDWVSNRFGRVLYEIFFKTYTEKVWGIPCTELSADWAAQRIRNLSLGRALIDALGFKNGGNGKVASLIESFHYPRLGPGQMFEAMANRLKGNGTRLLTGLKVMEIHHEHHSITGVHATSGNGGTFFPGSHCFSSMPISELVERMRPQAPDRVLQAAQSLRYRSIITVNLLFKKRTPLPDNWIYLHAPEVKAGRLQLYKNWSSSMVPPGEHSSLGFEYFCFEGDEMWTLADSSLIEIALRDLDHLKFYNKEDFLDGFVVRYAKAYPMYEDGYEKNLSIIRDWLINFHNLYCIGRYGQFRYNNMDHSMMTGILAVKLMLGENVDPWSVNAEGEYLEESNNKV